LNSFIDFLYGFFLWRGYFLRFNNREEPMCHPIKQRDGPWNSEVVVEFVDNPHFTHGVVWKSLYRKFSLLPLWGSSILSLILVAAYIVSSLHCCYFIR
jgi:hypothetical protein